MYCIFEINNKKRKLSLNKICDTSPFLVIYNNYFLYSLILANQNLRTTFSVWHVEFSTAGKSIKEKYFQFFFLLNLFYILPTYVTSCGIHRNRSILGIAGIKCITFCC